MKEFGGRIAVITGGGTGMGRELARQLAAEAAAAILDGVRAERWRILVGKDAAILDRMVRETPEEAYERSFVDRMRAEAGWALGE